MININTCSKCKGTGELPLIPCKRCHGKGYIIKDESNTMEKELTHQEMYDYLQDHLYEQDFLPVRLSFEIELGLVKRYIELFEKLEKK